MVALAAGCGPDPAVLEGTAPIESQAVASAVDQAPEASSPGEAVPPSAGVLGGEPTDPVTELPLTLLAILAADTPAEGRATIRDGGQGVIATFRAGELIDDEIRLVEVWPEYVVVEHVGERERLEFGEGTVDMSSHDVFYPDLADLDDAPNSMADTTQLQDGPGYVVKHPKNAWGTPRTITAILQGVRTYATRVRGGPEVHVGDVSKREGGPFPPHVSHQTGRDVDIGYVLSGPKANHKRFITATRHNLDVQRSWALVRALLDTQAVRYIFMDYAIQKLLHDQALDAGEDPGWVAGVFQYPKGSRAAHGTLRHWRGHVNHFHVRFQR